MNEITTAPVAYKDFAEVAERYREIMISHFRQKGSLVPIVFLFVQAPKITLVGDIADAVNASRTATTYSVTVCGTDYTALAAPMPEDGDERWLAALRAICRDVPHAHAALVICELELEAEGKTAHALFQTLEVRGAQTQSWLAEVDTTREVGAFEAIDADADRTSQHGLTGWFEHATVQ